MSVKVKICGIRDVASARVAAVAGADFLGFNFVPTSQRRVEVAVARMILRQVERDVAMVGVFRDAPVAYVNQASSTTATPLPELKTRSTASSP